MLDVSVLGVRASVSLASRGLGFRVSGLGFRVLGFRVISAGLQCRLRMPASHHELVGLGLGLGFRVSGLGFRTLGFRV